MPDSQKLKLLHGLLSTVVRNTKREITGKSAGFSGNGEIKSARLLLTELLGRPPNSDEISKVLSDRWEERAIK
jgi:hypothetical protein